MYMNMFKSIFNQQKKHGKTTNQKPTETLNCVSNTIIFLTQLFVLLVLVVDSLPTLTFDTARSFFLLDL